MHLVILDVLFKKTSIPEILDDLNFLEYNISLFFVLSIVITITLRKSKKSKSPTKDSKKTQLFTQNHLVHLNKYEKTNIIL